MRVKEVSPMGIELSSFWCVPDRSWICTAEAEPSMEREYAASTDVQVVDDASVHVASEPRVVVET